MLIISLVNATHADDVNVK